MYDQSEVHNFLWRNKIYFCLMFGTRGSCGRVDLPTDSEFSRHYRGLPTISFMIGQLKNVS